MTTRALTSTAPTARGRTRSVNSTTPSAAAKSARRASLAGAVAPLSVADAVRTPGQTLAAEIREPFERYFGRDFGQVRIHTGDAATRSAREINASAYAVGHDLVFDHGHFAPGSVDGRRLLAHELSHIAQSPDRAQSTATLTIDPPSDTPASERDAETSARGFPSGRRLSRVGQCARPAVRRKVAAPETPQAAQVYTLTIGDVVLQNASEVDARTALRRFYNRILARVAGDKEGHAYMDEIRKKQYIVGFFADRLGGVSMPPLTMWQDVENALTRAEKTVKKDSNDSIQSAVDQLVVAQALAQTAHDRFVMYRDGTITGADRSITVLKVTAAAGAVAATVATGGAAAGAGAGLLGTSAAVGLVGGAYGATQESASQLGEMTAGMRKNFDLKPILQRGATDAVTNFVGAFVGGALSKYAAKMFGSYLSKIGDEALVELGEQLGMKGPLPRDFFLTRGQRFIADFLGGIGASPLTTAVKVVTEKIVGKEEIPDGPKFVEMVIEEMIQGGAMQIFLGAILHGKAPSVSLKGAKPPSGGKSRPFSSLKSRLVGAAMHGVVEAAPITGGTGGGPGKITTIETGATNVRTVSPSAAPSSRFYVPEPGAPAPATTEAVASTPDAPVVSEPTARPNSEAAETSSSGLSATPEQSAPASAETASAETPLTNETVGTQNTSEEASSQNFEYEAKQAREESRTAKSAKREAYNQQRKQQQAEADVENFQYETDSAAEVYRETGKEKMQRAQFERGEANRLRHNAKRQAAAMMDKAKSGDLSRASPKTQAKALRTMDKRLRQAAGKQGWNVKDSNLKGKFDEAMRTTSLTKEQGGAQKGYVKENEKMPFMDEHISGSAIPDGVQGKWESGQWVTEYYNLKSDNIHTMDATAARSRARAYLDQATRNNTALPVKNRIAIRFAQNPAPEARGPILDVLFAPGSPIRAVHFQSEVVRNPNLP